VSNPTPTMAGKISESLPATIKGRLIIPRFLLLQFARVNALSYMRVELR